MLVLEHQGQRRPSKAFIPLTLSRSHRAICPLPIAPLQARSVYTRSLLPHRHLHLGALESGLDSPLHGLALAKVTYTQFAGGKVQQVRVCLCLASSHKERFPFDLALLVFFLLSSRCFTNLFFPVAQTRGAWPAPSTETATLYLGVVSLSPALGVRDYS